MTDEEALIARDTAKMYDLSKEFVNAYVDQMDEMKKLLEETNQDVKILTRKQAEEIGEMRRLLEKSNRELEDLRKQVDKKDEES
jgi:flagellar capping protein FliD